MSGTAYGTVVLHVTPESAAGGALALVRNGDEIELDVEARKLELCVIGGRTGPQTRRLDASATAGQAAVIRSCTSTTFCKRTKERILISWWARAARAYPGRVTEERRFWLLAPGF